MEQEKSAFIQRLIEERQEGKELQSSDQGDDLDNIDNLESRKKNCSSKLGVTELNSIAVFCSQMNIPVPAEVTSHLLEGEKMGRLIGVLIFLSIYSACFFVVLLLLITLVLDMDISFFSWFIRGGTFFIAFITVMMLSQIASITTKRIWEKLAGSL